MARIGPVHPSVTIDLKINFLSEISALRESVDVTCGNVTSNPIKGVTSVLDGFDPSFLSQVNLFLSFYPLNTLILSSPLSTTVTVELISKMLLENGPLIN